MIFTRASISTFVATYFPMILFQITNARQTNHDRTDLLRSTYSNPYEWIFPFGANGNGVRKNTWKVLLGESVEEARSEVLTLTLFQGIAVDGKNSLIELQKALACYWRSVRNMPKSMIFFCKNVFGGTFN